MAILKNLELPLAPTNAEENLEFGEHIRANVYKGSLSILGISEEVTIFKFPSKNNASVFVEELHKGKGCCFIVNLRTIKTYEKEKDGVGVYVVTEPLTLFEEGVKNLFKMEGKYCWKKDAKNTLGLGDGARQIFREVGKALYSLKKVGLFSNNIEKNAIQSKTCDGIWFGSDGSPRLCNFKCKELDFFNSFDDQERKELNRLRKQNPEVYEEKKSQWTFNGFKEDIKQYKELIQYVVYENPPDLPFLPRFKFLTDRKLELMFPTQSNDVTSKEFNLELGAFIKFVDSCFDKAIDAKSLVNSYSEYIYDSPICWTIEKHYYFFQQLDELVEFNHYIFYRGLLTHFDGWWAFLENHDENMRRVLHYESNKDKSMINKMKTIYLHGYGIVRFISNYEKPYNHGDDLDRSAYQKTRLEVFHLLPFIAGLAHCDIFLTLLFAITANDGPSALRKKSLCKLMRKKLDRFSC